MCRTVRADSGNPLRIFDSDFGVRPDRVAIFYGTILIFYNVMYFDIEEYTRGVILFNLLDRIAK